MHGLTIWVSNPFALRESLRIALEVTWFDLSPGQAFFVREFTCALPTSIVKMDVWISPEMQEALLFCLSHFHLTRTCHWLREDMCQYVQDLDQTLRAEVRRED